MLMSDIATHLKNIYDAKVDIASAIEEKGGVVPTGIAKYGDAIRSLPCSIDSIPVEDEEATWCIFVDCDANVVAVYSKDQIPSLEKLPDVPPPPIDGLVDGSWNWTLDEIKNAKFPMCVGPHYETPDSKTWIIIDIPNDGYEYHLARTSSTAGTVGVDWGDNSDETVMDSSSSIYSHVYEKAGRYTVKVRRITGNGIYIGGSMWTQSGPPDNASYPWVMRDMLVVKEVVLGKSYYCTERQFWGGININHIITSATPLSTSAAMGMGTWCGIKQLTLPRGLIHGFNCGGSWSPVQNMGRLRVICYPATATATAANQGGWSTFSGSNLILLRIPSLSWMTTGFCQFNNCRNLKYFRFPSDVILNRDSVFNNNISIQKIIFAEGETKITTIRNTTFSSCLRLEKLENLNYDIITSIGTQSFAYCEALWKNEEISFPAVTSLGNQCFQECRAVKKFTIGAAGETVTIVASSTFSGCNSLESIVFNGHISQVPANMCNNCFSLKTLDLSNCTSVPTLANVNAFNNTPNLKIIVPDDLYDSWIAASNWSNSAVVGKIVKASEA